MVHVTKDQLKVTNATLMNNIFLNIAIRYCKENGVWDDPICMVNEIFANILTEVHECINTIYMNDDFNFSPRPLQIQVLHYML